MSTKICVSVLILQISSLLAFPQTEDLGIDQNLLDEIFGGVSQNSGCFPNINDEEECSGNGFCESNSCLCYSGFSGKFCEICEVSKWHGFFGKSKKSLVGTGVCARKSRFSVT